MKHMLITSKRILCLILSVIILLITITGCGQKVQEMGPNTYLVFYISADENGIEPVPMTLDINERAQTSEIVNALVRELQSSPNGALYHTVLDESCGFLSATFSDNQVWVDFDESILKVDYVREILIRAALTRTFTQIRGISSVICTVNGETMLDSTGKAIGPMSVDTFIDNAGAQINAEERTQLTLYFANEDGDKLVKVNRMVVYSGNIAMDKLVMEQLLAGPGEKENAYGVLNPNTQIINVTTQDGTCYVNLSSEFLSPTGNITNDVAIYSIVDSLIELDSVNRVQFLVDSDSDVLYRETVNLNTQFNRNLDLVEE